MIGPRSERFPERNRGDARTDDKTRRNNVSRRLVAGTFARSLETRSPSVETRRRPDLGEHCVASRGKSIKWRLVSRISPLRCPPVFLSHPRHGAPAAHLVFHVTFPPSIIFPPYTRARTCTRVEEGSIVRASCIRFSRNSPLRYCIAYWGTPSRKCTRDCEKVKTIPEKERENRS